MFNVFIDGALQQVWQQNPGIPIPANGTTTSWTKLVALMYADDLSGLATSLEDLQQLADTTRMALARWRLTASVSPTDASKTAVMRVAGTATRAPQPPAMVRWGSTHIPFVNNYKYLGVHITADGNWETHLDQRMAAANKTARAQWRVLNNRSLPIRLRKYTFTTVVQPVLTYAAQVWTRPTATLRKKLDSWQMSLMARAFHCPPTTTHICLQQELGLTPLHITCDTLTIRYWHHLQQIKDDRLLRCVARAWTGAANPWQKAVAKLLSQYNIDQEEATTLTPTAFRSYCAKRAMEYLTDYWSSPPRCAAGPVWSRYKTAFGVADTTPGRPRPQPYTLKLTEEHVCKGHAAQLCMQLRMECLPLRAMHSYARNKESAAARQIRQQCPVCNTAQETATHFLLECPAYVDDRARLLHRLRLTQRPDDWRCLLGNDYLQRVDYTDAIADYVAAIWHKRKTALTGREANGGDPMALTPGPGPD
jgi:AraC-like DNA-binding protein